MPALSLHHLTTIDQCDAALKHARTERKTLLWKKLGLELQIERRLDAMAALEEKMLVKKTELAIASDTVARVPATSPLYRKYLDDKLHAEWEITMLEVRRNRLKPAWLVEKEWRLQCIEAALEQVSLAVLTLETHKAGLQKQAAKEETVAASTPRAPVRSLTTGEQKPAAVAQSQPQASSWFSPQTVRVNSFRSG